MHSEQKQTISQLALVVLSMIGIADAGYISYEELQGIIPPCGAGFDCGAVLQSPYAHVGPVPLAVLGLGYYLTIFVVSVLLVSEFKLNKLFGSHKHLKNSTILDILTILTSLGLLFSIYLVSIMAFVIEAWCKYCLISAVTSLLLFVATQIVISQQKKSSTFLKGIIHSIFHWKYKHLLKPFYFQFDPEDVHHGMISFGSLLGSTAAGTWFLSTFFGFSAPELKQTLHGVEFPNPIGLSAGFDYNGDLTDVLPALGFGWHTIGTVTYEPYAGNPKPRLGRFPRSQALLVNKGLKSIGTHAVIAKLQKKKLLIPTAISIASTNKHFSSLREQLLDIAASFYLFEHSRVRHHLYELNISCPNTFGGEPFTTPARLEVLLTLMDSLQLTKPLFIKMPIDQSKDETQALLTVIERHSVQGVIFGNLTKDKSNPALHPEDRAAWKTQRGNISGKPTFERSNTLIQLARTILPPHITVIGTGGIFSPEDVQIKNEKGAVLFQLITGMIYEGPQLIGQITRKLSIEKTS